jgi:molybdopterin/thiamine biosynthesis adenylyltransferase
MEEKIMNCSPKAERYSRQLDLIGVEGQRRLSHSKVLIVGLGGLGSIVSLYLAASGVGELILVDFDIIEESNLNRQIIYAAHEIGLPKPYIAGAKLKAINPCIKVQPIMRKIEKPEDLQEEAAKADAIVDALDNWETRLILDRIAHKHNKPLIHAAVEKYYGQVYLMIPNETPPLKTLAPGKTTRKTHQIIGPAAGIVASIEALITLQTLLGDYSNKGILHIIDARTLEIHKIKLRHETRENKQ